MELLWVLEETVDQAQDHADLIDEICEGPLLSAADPGLVDRAGQ